MSQRVLEGIKVVEMSTYIAGPICARILGDWGADVVKVEKFHGDPVRVLGMNMMAPVDDEENPAFFFANMNKRTLAMDQRKEGGREVMMKLLLQADVFITNNRDDALEKMGLDYETLKAKNPGLVFAHVLGYGETGPLKHRPAFDFTTYFARSGFMNVMPDSSGPPTMNTPGFGDAQLAMALAGGIAGALYKREKTGIGDYVSVSLYHIGIFDFGLLYAGEPYASIYPISREEPLSPLCCAYQCSDGEWFYLGTPDYINYCAKVFVALGLPELVDDEEYNNIFGMLAHRSEIRQMFEDKFIHKTSLEWEKIFEEADVPSERVFKLKDVLADEQAWACGFFETLKYENGNEGPLVTTPVRFRSMGRFDERIPSAVGCDSADVLRDLGFTEEEIRKLKEEKAVNFKE